MRTIFLSLSLLFSLLLNAQQDSVTHLAFGLGGGFLNSQVSLLNTLRNEYEIKPVGGIQLGASVRYFNKKTVGFVGELNFAQGGWQEISETNGPAFKRNLSYFEVQMLTQLAIGRKMIRPMIQAGPYLSFPIGQDDEVPTGFTIPSGDHYYGVKLPFRPNYGLTIGGGLYLQLGAIGLQLEGRYLAGFNDLVKSGTFGVAQSRRQAYGGRVTVFYEVY